MNFEAGYVSLAQVVADKLLINECRGWFLISGLVAENSLFTAIDNLQFNIKFKTSYVSLAPLVVVQPWVHESWE